MIFKEINDFFILWLENGNQYIKLEEPAHFVLTSYISGKDKKQIASECAVRYNNALQECEKFVDAIIAGFESYRQHPLKEENFDTPEIKDYKFESFSRKYYNINGKGLCFEFENAEYEYYTHPFIKHLEVLASPADSVVYEIFTYSGKVVLRVDKQVKGLWDLSDSHLFKGMTSMQILNVAYDKTDSDWMAVIHASAVSDGKKAIVFTAAPGSGKSTIAALLNKRGYEILSDDFVPVDRKTQSVFQYPAALSVKEGSSEMLSEYYPELLKDKSQFKTITNKKVKFIPIEYSVNSVKVTDIVLIKYDPDIDFIFEKISNKDALPQFMEETWTYPSAENAESFINWYQQLNFFVLKYSDNEKALNAIKNLFER